MIDRFVNVKVFKRPVGRRCMHCNSSARVTAWRRTGPRRGETFDLPIRYCLACAVKLGAIKEAT